MRILLLPLLLVLTDVHCWVPAACPGRSKSRLHSTTPSASSVAEDVRETDIDAASNNHTIIPMTGGISMSLTELSFYLGGTGRAKLVWDCYRVGIDPQKIYSTSVMDDDDDDDDDDDAAVSELLPAKRRTQRLGTEALQKLADTYPGLGKIEDGIASLSHLSTSFDSTTKMLLRLQDGLQVETVIIPFGGRSTLCISSQVGCKQGMSTDCC
jgi:hypothetical protein